MYRYRRSGARGAAAARGAADGPHPARLVKAFVNDLYRFEIRRLRDRLLRGEIPRPSYAAHVVELRKRYPLLSLDVRFWTEP